MFVGCKFFGQFTWWKRSSFQPSAPGSIGGKCLNFHTFWGRKKYGFPINTWRGKVWKSLHRGVYLFSGISHCRLSKGVHRILSLDSDATSPAKVVVFCFCFCLFVCLFVLFCFVLVIFFGRHTCQKEQKGYSWAFQDSFQGAIPVIARALFKPFPN